MKTGFFTNHKPQTGIFKTCTSINMNQDGKKQLGSLLKKFSSFFKKRKPATPAKKNEKADSDGVQPVASSEKHSLPVKPDKSQDSAAVDESAKAPSPSQESASVPASAEGTTKAQKPAAVPAPAEGTTKAQKPVEGTAKAKAKKPPQPEADSQDREKPEMQWERPHDVKVLLIYKKVKIGGDEESLCQELKKTDKAFTCSLEHIKQRLANFRFVDTDGKEGQAGGGPQVESVFNDYKSASVEDLEKGIRILLPPREDQQAEQDPSVKAKDADLLAVPLGHIKLEGLFAFKLSMTSFYDEKGRAVPVTALKYRPCRVTQVKTKEKDSYSAVQVAFVPQKNKRCPKPLVSHLQAGGFFDGARFVREIRQNPPKDIKPGQEVTIESLKKGDRVKISALSKGRGFAGVMKRWGFAGGKASHGSKSHRRIGSIGQHTQPGRVMPGRKMPGQCGFKKVSRLNVSVVDVLPEENMIFVKGPVPGARNTLVALKKISSQASKSLS